MAVCSVRVSTNCDEVMSLIYNSVQDLEGISIEIIMKDEKVECATVNGIDTFIAAFYTDIPFLKNSTHQSLLLGPGSILVAHGKDEFVNKADVVKAVELYGHMLLQLFKK